MVKFELIHEIRPKLTNEFHMGPFIPRTPAIAEAYRWGQEVHAGQKRFSGEPYFETHCGWVASFLDSLIGNEAWTIAGLLHDSIEDKGGSLDEIRARFPGRLGEEVAYIVDGVTKLSNPRDGRSRELETLRKIAMFRDPAIFLVKLADKSHNVLTLEHMPMSKRAKKAEEAIRAYGKLAGILNCYKWRRWLEDMAFPHYDPTTYAYIKSRIDADPRLNPDFINNLVRDLAGLMEKEGIDGRVEVIVNGYWQAWQKLRIMARERRASLTSFTPLNDLVSFRLIVNDPDWNKCYILLGAVNRHLASYLDQNRFDDYIASPQNGYRALQVTAWFGQYGAVEVAIATSEMEGENLWGVVYALQHGRDTSAYRPIEILTPTGGARFVPEGATVVDAVASIQQEFLLDKISKVKVNGSVVSLSDLVKPGDVVEVITSGQRLSPSEDWLKFSNTSTARLLRVVLARQAIRDSAEKGREMVRSVLSPRGITALEDVQVLEPDRLDNLLEKLSAASLEDLYAAIGAGAIRIVDISLALDELGLSKESLGWTTINIAGSSMENKPGVLAILAGLLSSEGGNIIRSVNNTRPDGSFSLRLVTSNLTPEKIEHLRHAYENCGFEFKTLEMV